MSAIAGICYLDGRPVNGTDLHRMVATLAHRGPDGAGVWHHGPAGLGHCMLWTTPESLQETLPLVSQSGALVLTADARIDNREELIATLGMADRPLGNITDSHLILAAYEKWGERCPERLLGDFAFAIWDGRRQTLFCARDHFGVRPFYYYYLPGRAFVFASEIKALHALSGVPRHLNEVRVADYLASVTEDKRSTFYQYIYRLPPAHSMVVDSQAAHCHAYWSLDPSYELRLPSDTAYAEAFREMFTTAVRCRLRSAFPLGTHLSGGLDSSAIACVARELLIQDETPLHTFSHVFDDVPQCDERPFIDAVLARGGFVPHYIHADRLRPLVDLDRVLWLHDEPFWGPNHYLPWELNRAAQQAGVRIVLDGFDGDTTVSHGAAYFSELARHGRWETFAAEAHAVSQHFDTSPLHLLQYYGLPYLEELARKWRWVAFATAANQLHHHFQVSRQHLMLHHGLKTLLPEWVWCMESALRGRNVSKQGIDAIVDRHFAQAVGLQARLQALQGSRSDAPRTAREEQWRSLTSGLFTLVLEQLDRSAAAFSMEARHPFMDKRLIGFCLALPPEQKLSQGWSRIVLRRALAKVLPQQVLWRGGKTDMTPNYLRGLLTFDRECLEEVMVNHVEDLARYINTATLQAAYSRLTSKSKVYIDDALTVWRVVILARWLLYLGQIHKSLDIVPEVMGHSCPSKATFLF
jgi:asparagine synthase (glutamine-hydrolysing)